jgi:hypothetical protein
MPRIKKKIIVPLKKLGIEHSGTHLIIKAKVNRKAAVLVVDTGASQTVLDKNRIHRFVKEKSFKKHDALSSGLGTKTMESHIVTIDQMEFGNLKISKRIFILLDLSHVNESYSEIGLKKIDGVLGGDILGLFNAVIDYGNSRLILNMPSVGVHKRKAARKR